MTFTAVANKHISEMTSTFKSKAKQFVSDIATDVKQNGHVSSLIKPTPTAIVPKQENGDPQVYREESRLAEHGKSNYCDLLWFVMKFCGR